MKSHNSLRISERVLFKLQSKHNVTPEEVEECFDNRRRKFLFDKRFRHQTNPPTEWFIAVTDSARVLKIVFVRLFNGMYEIKTAYEPNLVEVEFYEKNV